MEEFYYFTETIVLSDYFNEDFTIEEREEVLSEIWAYVLQENMHLTQRSQCGPGYNGCVGHAESAHTIRVGGCTALAIVLGAVTGGIGAITWPICMVTSGLLYQNDVDYCGEVHCS